MHYFAPDLQTWLAELSSKLVVAQRFGICNLLEWKKAIDPARGYLTEQHLTVGIHLQVQRQVRVPVS